jgi:dihydroorotate dehydrogenase
MMAREAAEAGADAIEIRSGERKKLAGKLDEWTGISGLSKIFAEVKKSVKIPIWSKPTTIARLLVSHTGELQYSNPYQQIKTAVDSGIDALTLQAPSPHGMILDLSTGKPKLGKKEGYGAISGTAVKPYGIRWISTITRIVQNTPVIAAGGVTSGTDVIEYIMAGATAVGVYTAAIWYGDAIIHKIVEEIENFMKENNYSNLEEIRGKAHSQLPPLESSFTDWYQNL